MVEQFRIVFDGEKVTSPDFPDAAKIIQLDSRISHRIADLQLHMSDLGFAMECLTKVNEHSDLVVRNSLFFSGVVFFFKCFGANESRTGISAEKIYRADKEGIQIFNFYKDFRDKHIVHDENALSQAIPGAVLNKHDSEFKIAKILSTHLTVNMLTQENWANMHLLIIRAQEWCQKEFEQLCVQLTTELEKIPYHELLALPEKKIFMPELDDVSKSRKKKA